MNVCVLRSVAAVVQSPTRKHFSLHTRLAASQTDRQPAGERILQEPRAVGLFCLMGNWLAVDISKEV